MLSLSVSLVNEDKGYQFYDDTSPVEDISMKSLYRNLAREYGRCTGHVYIDTDSGAEPIGWVFVKRVEYSDSRHGETFLQTAWCSFVEVIPARKSVVSLKAARKQTDC